MWIPIHGGIEVNSEEELRLAVACLPTPEEIARAKQAAADERAEVFRQTGIAIDSNGRIVLRQVA